jgi:hypothetical protein
MAVAGHRSPSAAVSHRPFIVFTPSPLTWFSGDPPLLPPCQAGPALRVDFILFWIDLISQKLHKFLKYIENTIRLGKI